jgi:hypothetical protein
MVIRFNDYELKSAKNKKGRTISDPAPVFDS